MGCPSEVKIGDNLVFSVTTHNPSTNVLTDADSVPTYRVYEDETGTAILNGSMAKLDDTNTTGYYSESIECTEGNGFEDGKNYTIYIEATVSSITGGKSYGFKAVATGTKFSSNEMEALRNIPAIIRFSTDGTPSTATISGPNPNISVTSNITQLNNDNWQVVFTPTLCGPWQVAINDSSGNLLHSERVECVDATVKQNALGLQPPYHDTITVWPEALYDSGGGTSSLSVTASSSRTLFSVGRWVVPYRGWIYGITFDAQAGLTNLDSLEFVTLHGSGTSWYCRDVSDDLSDGLPVSGSWTTAEQTYYFDKPVWAEAGDCFGFYGVNSTGGTVNYGQHTAVLSPTGVNSAIHSISGTLDKTGLANTSASWSTSRLVDIKLIMAPPEIVIAGHSIWAGHCTGGNPSASVYENHDATLTFERDYDPGVMLSEILGVSVCNVADGGTNIQGHWVGASGLFEQNVVPLRPSVVIYDTALNDSNSGGAFSGDPTTYPDYLGHLLAHCDEIGAQLILMEGPPSRAADDGTEAALLESFNAVALAWAEHNGVPYLPLHHRLGQHSGGAEHDSLRRYQKNTLSGISDYYAAADSYCHLTDTGRYAAMVAVAEGIRSRTIPTRQLSPRTTYDEVIPQDAMNAGHADAVSILEDTETTLPATLTTMDNKLDVIEAFIDDEIASILEDTGTTIPATLVALDALIDAIKAKTDLLPDDVDGKSMQQAFQYISAGVAGIISGAGTDTEIFLGLDKSTPRLTVTADENGNRTAIEYGDG